MILLKNIAISIRLCSVGIQSFPDRLQLVNPESLSGCKDEVISKYLFYGKESHVTNTVTTHLKVLVHLLRCITIQHSSPMLPTSGHQRLSSFSNTLLSTPPALQQVNDGACLACQQLTDLVNLTSGKTLEAQSVLRMVTQSAVATDSPAQSSCPPGSHLASINVIQSSSH